MHLDAGRIFSGLFFSFQTLFRLVCCRPATIDDLERIAELEVGTSRDKQGQRPGGSAAKKWCLGFPGGGYDDVCLACCMQALGYPPDEAASKQKIEYRLRSAPGLFMAAVKASNDQIIGFTCATATTKEKLEAETMSIHEPDGTSVCIHSVCVAMEEQRKGVATRMLNAYIQWVPQAFPSATNLQLICKAGKVNILDATCLSLLASCLPRSDSRVWYSLELLYRLQKGLYERVGFKLIGPSQVVHGSESWLDMMLDLP